MNEIYGWVKNIIIFLVLTSILTNLLGKSSYKKYVNLVTGIILVILVLSPLLKLFQLDGTFDYYFTTNSLLTKAQDMDGKLEGMEEKQRTAVISVYKTEIMNQVKKLLNTQNISVSSIDVAVEEDESSTEFGSMIALNIEGRYSNGDEITKDEGKEVVNIENIVIDKIKIDKQEDNNEITSKNYISPVEINAKKLLSDFYNMNPDNINISIQE